MTEGPIRNVVIVGGGTAGWMCAAAFSRFLDDGQRTITLVESDQIGTIGVGEATIPPIRDFNAMIGVDERTFLAETQGSIKLGIEFRGWGEEGETYLHPFGEPGQDFEGVSFHQFWLKHRLGRFEDYFLTAALARRDACYHPAMAESGPVKRLTYAYHFDAGLYAAHLRRLAESRGTRRVEGEVLRAELSPDNGHVVALELAGERRIEGDLFIDCSGFRSLLLGDALGVELDDWTHLLPCDRAIAVPSARTEPLSPYTRATAHRAGWQWRIPLQHRTGNGIVYSSAFLGDDEAADILLGNLESQALDDPRALRFTSGVRRRLWERNVVAVGLSAGFIEPLESTAIHLVQSGITRLFWLFPDRQFSPTLAAEYNRVMVEQYEYVRDFIVLHYNATRRDEPFWREMASLEVPDALTRKLALFRAGGRVQRYDHDLFGVPSWVAVMLGQGVEPAGYDPLVESMDPARVRAAMEQIAAAYRDLASRAPSHAALLEQVGASAKLRSEA